MIKSNVKSRLKKLEKKAEAKPGNGILCLEVIPFYPYFTPILCFIPPFLPFIWGVYPV